MPPARLHVAHPRHHHAVPHLLREDACARMKEAEEGSLEKSLALTLTLALTLALTLTLSLTLALA